MKFLILFCLLSCTTKTYKPSKEAKRQRKIFNCVRKLLKMKYELFEAEKVCNAIYTKEKDDF